MAPQLFQSFIDCISTLTPDQKCILKSSLAAAGIPSEVEQDDMPISNVFSGDLSHSTQLQDSIEKRFAEYPVCPHCRGRDVIRWGFHKCRQRYRCESCACTFTAFTCTPLHKLRYPEKWDQYLESMTHSMTLRPAAFYFDIDLKTAFRWRHRFLKIINNDQAGELTGIIELDETFFHENFKGQRENLPRPARKRGNDKHQARKIPVMVARDREKNTVDGLMKNESANELCRHLNGKISIEAAVCADAHLAHEKLAETLGFEFKELVTSAGQHVIDGVYHIQHVNSYHSQLKRWINGVFEGVATKYLSHYLAWRRKLTGSVKLTKRLFIEKLASRWPYQQVTAT